jgi:uncharacterized membrane protein YfbV (UPF0208 family)
MDKQVLALLIPILALSIPVVGIIFTGLVKLQRARAEGRADPALLAEVEDLRHEVQQVRAELAEVQERLDFTERLLTSAREK